MIEKMPDAELMALIVNDQVAVIRAQRRYANNPLAMSSGTAEHRKMISDAWAVALERGLNMTIHEQVEAELERLKRAGVPYA